MTKFLKLGGLMFLVLFLVACDENTTFDEGLQQSVAGENENVTNLTELNETLFFSYLTYHEAEVLLIDLATGDVLASYVVDETYATVAEVFDFGNGYFAALVGILSPQEIAFRNRDFDAEWVEHDARPRFLLFDEHLDLLEVFWLDETPYEIYFPWMYGLLTFKNNELIVFFQTFEDPDFPEILFQSYNFHTGELITIAETDIVLLDFISIDSEQLFFRGAINETGDPFAPATLAYGVINLVDGTIVKQRQDTFNTALGSQIDISNARALLPEQLEVFMFEDNQQAYHAVLLVELVTLESRLFELQEGDSHLARFSYDGNHLVTINTVFTPIEDSFIREFAYFRKYDLETGAVVFETTLDPIPELVEFEQIQTWVTPAIVPISESVYAIVLINQTFFGFYNVHQLIVLPSS